MQVPDVDIGFNSTSDHAKWAVASDAGEYWICIGDINRAVNICRIILQHVSTYLLLGSSTA